MPVINGNDSSNVLFDTSGNDTINAYLGNDLITVTTGQDAVYGGGGTDTLIFNWSATSAAIDFDGSYGQAFVDTAGNGLYSSSTWRVYFSSIEHFNVTTGAGNDRLEGRYNLSDTLNGNGGTDEWEDGFTSLLTGMSIDMAAVSSASGQSYGDGTFVRNLEIADLDLTQGNDTFRDHGNHSDSISGDLGDDDIGTSGGQDVFYAGSGDDTLTIDWSNATQDADVDGSYGQSFVDTASNGLFSSSTRRVAHSSFEHLDVTTGSGDDRLEGRYDYTDTLNGGAGDDEWEDGFSGLTTALDIDMALVSTAGGQTLSDGTIVRNLEQADVEMTQGDDTFRDHGDFNDDISGGLGDDDIGTSGGQDAFWASTGDDTLTIDWSNATQDADVDGSYGQSFVDTANNGVYSSSTRRVFHSQFEHMDVTTGSGDDRLEGRYNYTDTLDGGAGDDEWEDGFTNLTTALDIDMALVSTAGGQTLSDGTIVRNLEQADVEMTQGNDTFRDHGSYDDAVSGDLGNDDIGSSGGRDYFYGGSGTDTLTVDWSTGTEGSDFDGGYGQAFVRTAGAATYSASTRRVGFSGFEQVNVTGTSGDDRLEGMTTGSDTLRGGDGNDTLLGSGGGDLLFGGDGNDLVYDETGNDTLDAGAGNDTVHEHAGGTDSFLLGAGDDRLIIHDITIDNDTFNGGLGDDTLDFSNVLLANGTLVSLTRSQILSGGNSERVFNFEHIEGGSADENLQGNSAGNRINAGSGNDSLYGFDGNDRLDGGLGNDLLVGGLDHDTLLGNTGNDTLNAHGGNDSLNGGAGADFLGGQHGLDTLFGGAGNDTIFGGASNDTINAGADDDDVNGGTGNDSISGSTGNDTMRGGGQADTLDGGGGNDSLIGDVGSDLLIGGTGTDTLNGGGNGDTLRGGGGNDLLRGQDGFDQLDGGVGNDTLTGGAQLDDFIFGAGYEADLVTDFANDVDELHLNDNLWGGGLTAQQVVSTYATVSTGNTVFDFGNGDVLTVNNISNAQLLVDDIIII